MSRIRLRVRVRVLTGVFALVLIGITFFLSWRAGQTQARWRRIAGVEMAAVSTLEELIRAQNGYRAHLDLTDPLAADRYREVEQLIAPRRIGTADVGTMRQRLSAFRRTLDERPRSVRVIDIESARVTAEAQHLIDERKAGIARQLPMLQRESRDLMLIGLGVAWIVAVLSLAVATTTINGVVRPVEDLAAAARRIAERELNVRAPIGGDFEIVELGRAVNRMADELKAHARTDDLTALPNFRAFRERIDEEIARSNRWQHSFGVLILDLDRFKYYNDRFGHLAGNDALQRVARVIRETVRAVDFPARYGGEEFAVILPETDVTALSRIAERVRLNVEALSSPPGGGVVTISIGAAIYPGDGASVEALFQTADERLYQAKRGGRNRVVVNSTARVVQSAG